jgi:transmembrane sensor
MKNDGDENLSHDVIEMAAAFDARSRVADCTGSEREQFRQWYEESASHQQSFDELQALLGGLRGAGNEPEIRSMREAALDAAGLRIKRRHVIGWAIGIAASLCALALGMQLFGVDIPGSENIRRGEAPYFATAIGERSTTNLDDGTVAVLNTNTRLQVAYSEDVRLVTLYQGQALFEVAKNPDRPFVVVAGDQRITAIGTIFDVRNEKGKVKITLVEGVVEVTTGEPMGSSLNGPIVSQPPVRLTPGQQLSTSAVALAIVPVVNNTDVDRATIWQKGRVFFEDVPLSEAIAEMNRYSTTQIVLGHPSLQLFRVNGMFRTGQQPNFIDALQEYFPIKAIQESPNQILLKLEHQKS